ncbi:MAG: class IV adenylate cyclase [Candidatus Hydrothermarchaeaceae archaeon]
MLEIEVKAKLRRPVETRERLLAMGAKYVETKVQVDTYYNHPSRDFASTDEALRLREQDGRVILTYKGPKVDEVTKTREEVKVEVSELESADEILEQLGFRKVRRVRKKRNYYVLRGMKVMLDEVDGLGNYIEVEKPGEEYEPRELIDFLREIGVDEKDMERRSYLELLMERGS